MAERPILFGAEMVKAILDERKTQTRRIIKPQPDGPLVTDGSIWVKQGKIHVAPADRAWYCPYGTVGDRLWVRETFAIIDTTDDMLEVYYPADETRFWYRVNDKTWEKYGASAFTMSNRPSIFMPRWASRIDLEIASIRVQRVQDIGEGEAVREGISIEYACAVQRSPIVLFRELWDRINAHRGYSWASNPWVWVVEFTPRERGS